MPKVTLMTRIFLFLAIVGLGGCAVVEGGLFKQREPAPRVQDGSNQVHPVPRPSDDAPPAGANTAEALDTTSAVERAQAVAAATPAGGERDLGLTIASLGAVTETGIWLKTPLVKAPASGRIEYTKTGKAVAVELIPLDAAPGSGSQISLAAMRLIEADLTDLPEIRVFRKN